MSNQFPPFETILPEKPVTRPAVAAPPQHGRGRVGYGVAIVAGLVVLAAMTAQRTGRPDALIFPAAKAEPARFTTPLPLPSGVTSGGTILGASGRAIPAPQFSVPDAAPIPMTTMVGTPTPGGSGAAVVATTTPMTRLGAPAMILDLSDAGGATSIASKPAGATIANPALAGTTKPGDNTGNDAGQFLQSVSDSPQRATATRMSRTDAVIAEGTVLSATLETAINTDLPGLARAVISRNVMSFDGTRVLIPRGSRVVGQYKSGVAMGASRVFIIWTRLIRPDGVSIQLVSPGGDDLGRGGLAGKVSRHFFQRFGGAILTSVLNGAVTLGSSALSNGAPVYINSMADATAAASTAVRSTDILPTIKTAPGVLMKIFVARDLDFSGLEDPR